MFGESSINPKIMMLISKQMNELRRKSIEGITIITNERDILDIQADIQGPSKISFKKQLIQLIVDTPYEQGVFRCKLQIMGEFPKIPPKGYFLTKIFHPNISEKGEICVNTLKRDWDASKWSLENIFQVIKCLLIIPFPESALNDEAGRMFMENYNEYFKYAQMITQMHAIPKENKLQQQMFSCPTKTCSQKIKESEAISNGNNPVKKINLDLNQSQEQEQHTSEFQILHKENTNNSKIESIQNANLI